MPLVELAPCLKVLDELGLRLHHPLNGALTVLDGAGGQIAANLDKVVQRVSQRGGVDLQLWVDADIDVVVTIDRRNDDESILVFDFDGLVAAEVRKAISCILLAVAMNKHTTGFVSEVGLPDSSEEWLRFLRGQTSTQPGLADILVVAKHDDGHHDLRIGMQSWLVSQAISSSVAGGVGGVGSEA